MIVHGLIIAWDDIRRVSLFENLQEHLNFEYIFFLYIFEADFDKT
jgi:hypothetical protein